MKKSILCYALLLMLCSSCQKAIDLIVKKGVGAKPPVLTQDGYTKYTIKKGYHYANASAYQPVETNEMKFFVKFDSTAIYQSGTKENQFDINKLYGFSDNNAGHHQYSARIGWSWTEGTLHLYAYVYNGGVVVSKPLTTIPIGAETYCSIKVVPQGYLFTVNEVSEQLPRLSTTVQAKGYQLYPYFGGNESAPHDVNIWIKKG